MSSQWQVTERQLLELLADRATFGLTRREEENLQHLMESMPDFDTECMERAAATVQLACTSAEPMPEDVCAKIRAGGVRYVSTRSWE